MASRSPERAWARARDHPQARVYAGSPDSLIVDSSIEAFQSQSCPTSKSCSLPSRLGHPSALSGLADVQDWLVSEGAHGIDVETVREPVAQVLRGLDLM